MRQYDDVQCTLTTCALHVATKHEWDYYDAVKRIKIRLKKHFYAISESRLVIELTNESALVCDGSTKVAEATVT